MTQVRRISDALKVRAVHQRDEIAHDGVTRAITYAQWDAEADAIGGGLAAAGLVPGDRVFLEDLIKAEWIEVWNQGNGPRRLSGVATWDGTDFELDEADRGDLPEIVG